MLNVQYPGNQKIATEIKNVVSRTKLNKRLLYNGIEFNVQYLRNANIVTEFENLVSIKGNQRQRFFSFKFIQHFWFC